VHDNVRKCLCARMCKSELVETEVEKDLGMLGTSAQAAAKGIGSIGVSLLSFLVCSVHDTACPVFVCPCVFFCRVCLVAFLCPVCFGPSLSCVHVCMCALCGCVCGYVYVRPVWMCVCGYVYVRATCVYPSGPSLFCVPPSVSPLSLFLLSFCVCGVLHAGVLV